MSEIEELQEKKRFKTREERQHEAMEARLDRLAELRGDCIEDVIGYVYRETWGSDKTSLPPVRGVLEDHELGLLYGPGRYVVSYRFVDLSAISSEDEDVEIGQIKRKSTTLRYSIGPEYADLHREDCLTHGRKCFLDSRTAMPGFEQEKNTGVMSIFKDDNLKGILGFLTVLKSFMPSNGSDDMRAMLSENTKIIQAMMSGGKSSAALPDKIMELTFTKMLERPQEKSTAEVMKEQLNMFEVIDRLRNPEGAEKKRQEDEERMKSPLEKMIDKALEFLPEFLNRFSGDERAAAQAVKKENPMAAIMLKSLAAQKAFYKATTEKYGMSAADRWAMAFGIDPMAMKTEVHYQQPAKPQSSPDSISLG